MLHHQSTKSIVLSVILQSIHINFTSYFSILIHAVAMFFTRMQIHIQNFSFCEVKSFERRAGRAGDDPQLRTGQQFWYYKQQCIMLCVESIYTLLIYDYQKKKKIDYQHKQMRNTCFRFRFVSTSLTFVNTFDIIEL